MNIVSISRYTFFASIIALTALSACSNSVSDDDHDHAEADGFVLKMNGQTIVEQLPDADLTGSIEIEVGEETSLITVYFLDHDGDEFQPDEEEHALGYEFTTDEIVEFEQHDEDGLWSFHLHGESAGTTNLILSILHAGHSDFETQPIPVTVTAPSN